MAISLVQTATGGETGGTGAAITIGSATTANNLLVTAVYIVNDTSDSTQCTATISGWTQAVYQNRSGNGSNQMNGVYIFYKIADGTETTVPISLSVARKHVSHFAEFSGITTTSPLDKTNSTDQPSLANSVSTGSTGTLAQAEELAIAAAGWGDDAWSADSWDSPFTETTTMIQWGGSGTDLSGAMAYRITSATTALNATHNVTGTNEDAIACIATFKGVGGGGTTFEESVSIGASSGVSAQTNAIFEASTSLAAEHSAAPGGQADMQALVAVATELQALLTAGLIVDADTTVGALHAIALAQDGSVEVSTTLSTVLADIIQADAVLNAQTSLGVLLNVLLSATKTTDAQLSIATSLASAFAGGVDLSVSITVGGQSSAAFAGETLTGPQIHEAALSIGVAQSVQALSTANLFASTALGSALHLTAAGGSEVEAALAVAIQSAVTQQVDLSIEGAVSLATQNAVSSAVQGDYAGSITLAHQVGVQLIANAVLNSGLDLSAIQSITTDGFVLVVGLQTPEGRNFTVRAIDRTFTVPGIDRDIDVKH